MHKKLKIFLMVIGAMAVMGTVMLVSLVHYGSRYFASAEIETMDLPGDDLLAPGDRQLQQTLVIEIDAPPSKLWPLLVQMGQKYAGFYSFELLERLFTFDIHNTYEIVPQWQDKMKAGRWMYYHQRGIGSEIMEVKEGKYFTMLSDSRVKPKDNKAFALNPFPGGEFAWTWNFILQELPGNRTRFIERCAAHYKPVNFMTTTLVKLFLGVPSIVMCTDQMEVLKALAEGKAVE